MNEIDKGILSKAHTLFSSPEIASRMCDLLVTKRPDGVKHSCYYPYYKEFWGEKMKVAADKMIADREDIIYRYSEYCGDNGVSEQTLYLIVNQSIRYLVEKMDTPELKYRLWYDATQRKRSQKRGGVTISWIRGLESFGVKDFVGESVIPVEAGTPKWMVDMNEWLEGDGAKPFLRERLTLSQEEVVELKQQIAACRGVIGSINAVQVKLMKVNE